MFASTRARRSGKETLLADIEEGVEVDHEGCLNPSPINDPYPHANLPVYKTIHRIRRLVLASIDDPYTLEQLQGPRINVSLVRPLVDRLYGDGKDISIVYCLLVNRSQFIRDQSYQAHHQTVNLTRATLCELLATRIFRRFHEDNPNQQGLLLLANILVAGFEPFQGAPDEILSESLSASQWAYSKSHGYGKMSALEVAIISESKTFLSSTASQKVVEAVYIGRVVYTPSSFIDLIPDRYKQKGISLYDPRRASILNQYRLVVPRTRNILEVLHFILLMFLYTAAMVRRDYSYFSGWEIAFMVYAAGWVLDEFASVLEHGWKVHTQNLWSFLDITFIVIYIMYLCIRIHGWSVGSIEEARQALDILACAAPIIFPRIAFNIMPENLLFISLRAMMSDFLVLTAIAVWCFGGFLLALRWLSRWSSPNEESDPTDATTIGKWMLWIWFGLDGTGIQRSTDFHLILGPILMIAFAFLGNTLFLTILVSMLSNTFSKLVADATAEIQFRRAVLTFEGVKSDAIFAYRPPFNIPALLILVPLRFCVTPRWFHKIHITAARILNLPFLLFINTYERKYLWKKKTYTPGAPVKRNKSGFFSSFSVHGDIQAVFDAEPPDAVLRELEEEDEIDEDILEMGVGRNRSISPGRAMSLSTGNGSMGRRRRWSSVVSDAGEDGD
ncbi:Serine palmitoyltransferase 1 [Venturia inaequalis]|nr:Serine palmitoyltransferase 1 [Venturia inaequalis]